MPPARIIDVGAGSSTLVDELLDRGFGDISLVDVSGAALAATRARLGEPSGVEYLVGDALSLDTEPVDLWHDRAAFHFLVDSGDKSRYAAVMARHVRPGGYAVLATFAADGPEQCSGLPVSRYSPEALERLFTPEFRLVAARRDIHTTPSGAEQPFTWVLLRRAGEPERTG